MAHRPPDFRACTRCRQVRCLLPILQAFGERVGKPRGADRSGRASDVVFHAPVYGELLTEVELEPRRTRIAITRLADAAGVDQPVALLEVQLLAVLAGLAGRGASRGPAERERDVRVADQAYPVALRIKAQVGLEIRQDVLPYW